MFTSYAMHLQQCYRITDKRWCKSAREMPAVVMPVLVTKIYEKVNANR